MAERPRWSLALALALRYLLGGRSRLLVGTVRAAVGSTGLGVTAMVVAMSLMTGYTAEVRDKLLENGSVIVYPRIGDFGEESLAPGDPRPADLLGVPGVTRVERAAYAQASLSSELEPTGIDIMLRGIEPLPADTARGAMQADERQLLTRDGIPGVVLGHDLAKRLRVSEGDTLKLVVVSLESRGPRFRYRRVRATGTFVTGFAEFDRSHAVIASDVLEELGQAAVLYEVVTDDLDAVDRVHEVAESLLGENYLVTDWRRQNPGLFTALRLQKWALFLTLGLIVVVSTFNVASTLVVLVREKMRDVGVLSALGLRPAQLRQLFLFAGLLLGGLGTVLGLALGSAIAWLLTTFRLIRFDSEVAAIYFIDTVPFDVRIWDLLGISAFSLLVTLVACWLPARRAARIEPAVALRYE